MEVKMKKFIHFIILLMIFTSIAIAGSTGKIMGTVTDAQTGEPLPGVNVVVEGTVLGAATDKDGVYFILNVPPGNYKVTASMIGYTTVTKTDVDVNIDQTTRLNFQLKPEAIAGEEVVIVAEKPPVEIDLTASKQRITKTEIENTWVATVKDAVEIQSGVNIHGGIRGSLGLEVAYIIDGIDVRDMGSNSTFLEANTTAIEEMEILTGGWNAEYAQAAGAIVNIVTKSSPTSWHGNFKIRFRPAGKYHWGRNIYSKENMEWKVIDREYFEYQSGGKTWDEYWTNVLGELPSPDFNWQKYQELITPPPVLRDYTKRPQWEGEATVYGPVTSKIDVMLSSKFLRRVNRFPSALAYNPEWNLTFKLNYRITENTKLTLHTLYQGTDNTGTPKLAYASSQEMKTYNFSSLITSAFDLSKYDPFGAYAAVSNSKTSIYSPQYIRNWFYSAKLTHVFSPETFLELSITHNRLSYKADFSKVYKWTFEDHQKHLHDPLAFEPLWFDNPPHQLKQLWGRPGDVFKDYAFSRNTTIKLDITSQIHPNHLVKTGVSFSPQYFNRYTRFAFKEPTCNIDDYVDPSAHPYEGAAYIQDKIETNGMIVNAGVRIDFFNANKKVNYTIFDPMALSDSTKGNKGIGIVSFDPNGPYAVKTPTRVAISPRLGISHPITSTTVLHFMYGHFNQRPAWTQIVRNPLLFHRPVDPWVLETFPEIHPLPLDSTKFMYMGWKGIAGNPALDYQRVIQYEVGFDQSIKDIARLDATLYYKDAKGLTNIGYQQGEGIPSYGTSAGGARVQLYPDPRNPTKPLKGKQVGWFTIPINGGRRDARGLEFTLDVFPLKIFDFRVIYNMSWVRTGAYGPTRLYRKFKDPDGKEYSLGRDRFAGGTDNINEVWNPAHTVKLFANLKLPGNFGPSVFGFRPLANWNMNVYHQYASPRRFTYHSVIQGDYSTEPLNRKWKAHHKTNLTVSRRFNMGFGLKANFKIEVVNLFNNKVYNLFSGQDLVNYMEYGELPKVHYNYKTKDGGTATWSEVNEWGIYSRDLMPREVYFTVNFEF